MAYRSVLLVALMCGTLSAAPPDEPFKTQLNAFLDAATSGRFERVELGSRMGPDGGGHNVHWLSRPLAYFETCVTTRAGLNSDGPKEVNCGLTAAGRDAAERLFFQVRAAVDAALPPLYDSEMYRDPPAGFGANALPFSSPRTVQWTRDPSEAAVRLRVDVMGRIYFVSIQVMPASQAALSPRAVEVIGLPDDSPYMAGDCCVARLDNGRAVIDTSFSLWQPAVSVVLRDFFLAHESAHHELGHVRRNAVTPPTDAQRSVQESQADQQALSSLSTTPAASRPIALRLRAEAEKALTASSGHPIPANRLRSLLRFANEASQIFAAPGEPDSDVDLREISTKPGAGLTTYRLGYANNGSGEVTCTVTVAIVHGSTADYASIRSADYVQRFSKTVALPAGSYAPVEFTVPSSVVKAGTTVIYPYADEHRDLIRCKAAT